MAISLSSPPSGNKIHTVGSLSYDQRGLTMLFGWLLWGDFAFNFFEQIFSRFMPLYLNDLHASNTLIAIMTGSIAGVVNLLFLPNISCWSDRLRSRIGRRIPLLLIATPLTVLSVILVGFAPEVGDWFYGTFIGTTPLSLSKDTLLLYFLCTFTVSFHFFNMVLVNAFNWLVRDVVPSDLMARFLSWFRIVGTLSTALFSWYVFPTMLNHRQLVFSSVGIFYLLAFSLMCWGVKEGKYDDIPLETRPVSTLKIYCNYFQECLKLPIYRNFILWYVLQLMSGACSGAFITLFSRNTIGLSMGTIGEIGTYGMLFSVLIYAPMGWVCDKYNDFRVYLISAVIGLSIPLLSYFFIHGWKSMLILSLIGTIPGIASALAGASLVMHIFPKKSFGQFSGALNVFGCTGWLVGNYLIGVFMDIGNSCYRLAFIWQFVFTALSLVPMFYVYRSWRELGGPNNYDAPDPTIM